jgi:hypothetical protein
MTTNDERAVFERLALKREGCWGWRGYVMPNGYTQASIRSRHEYGHRLAYRLHKGPIPAGLLVMHSCDNRGCVNPDHLVAGTQRDNIADMDAKGRGRRPVLRGEANGHAKLTDAQVVEVRARAAAGERQTDIGASLGIRQSHVSRLVRREQRQ